MVDIGNCRHARLLCRAAPAAKSSLARSQLTQLTHPICARAHPISTLAGAQPTRTAWRFQV